MSEITDRKIMMSIDLKKNRLRVHRQTMNLLGSPSFVQLLFSPKQGAIVILKCEKQTPQGQEIPVVLDKPGPSGTFDIYCKELISRIRHEFGGLDQPGLYHLRGYSVHDETGVCFPLSTLNRTEEANE